MLTSFGRVKFQYILIISFIIIAYLTFRNYGLWYGYEAVTIESSSPKTKVEGQDLEYIILIDAGSSGSRVFIYTWPPHTGKPSQLLQIRPVSQSNGEPVVKKVEPGLSSISGQPWKADIYMHPLLEFASTIIPPDKHKITPLYILATAGLRLLPSDIQNAILEDLVTDIPKNFSFRFTENSAEVISGMQEGIFQWIAINYVLGRFNHNTSGPITTVDIEDAQSQTPIFRKKTVGILDMGGASMQLAVEITTKAQVDGIQMDKQSSVTEINLGCDDHSFDHLYRIYVATYLGMGANELRDFYEEFLAGQVISPNSTNSTVSKIVNDTCLPVDLTTNLRSQSNRAKPSATDSPSVTVFHGTGDYDECRKSLQPLLQRLFNCSGTPCLSDQLPRYLEMNDFYGFSEFWYTMEDVLRIGGPYQYYKFRKSAKSFCATSWSVLEERFQRHDYPLADANRLKYQCFKSAWLTVALHNGLGLSLDYTGLRSSPNTVKGDVVHWTLGAAILKTRFLPLREIQKGNSHLPNKVVGSSWSFHLNNFSLVICFIVVLAAIFLYLKRLQCLKNFYVNKSSAQLLSPLLVQDIETGYVNDI